MTNILIDARALADENSGGVGRVAKIWIDSKLAEYAPARFVLVTTGWKPSTIVKSFCDGKSLEYLHIKMPNKLWSMACRLKMMTLDKTTTKKLKIKIDKILLPNLGFTGPLQTPYELLAHDVSFAIEPRWFGWKRRWWHKMLPVREIITGAEKLECVSETTRRDIIKLFGVDQNKTNVFKFDPTLPDGDSLRPKWLPEIVKNFVLILGGADRRKNAETALKAVAHYNMAHPQQYIVPVVLGGKVEQKSPMKISALEIEKKVSDEELRFLYKNAIVLLYPSWYEGFGLPLHEAHQFGTPVIASSTGALPETAPEGTVFCNPAKVNEWVGGIETLVTSYK